MSSEAFKQAMATAGLFTHGDIIADGQLHRINIQGDRPKSKNGWYILFLDGTPSGAFGSWKTGIKRTWCAKAKSELSQAEIFEHQRRMKAAQQAREAQESDIKRAASERAIAIWQSSIAAPDDHPYLLKKGVKSFGIRASKHELVIPVFDKMGTLHSLQFIDPYGQKRFLKGGKKKGCYFLIGKAQDVICIAEGYATSASIHEATGYAVATAFDVGNLESVAIEIRAKFPTFKIIICADNDEENPSNPGLNKARAAAKAVKGFLAYPSRTKKHD